MNIEDLKTQLVATMLDVMDISKKFQTMETKEIDTLISAAINPTAKRVNPIIKKLYDLETTISNLHSEFKKASLRAMITTKDPECDDPKSVPSVPVPEAEVKPEVKTDVKPEVKTEVKSAGRPKKVKEEVKTEEPKVEETKVEEPKIDSKIISRAKKVKEPEASTEESKSEFKPVVSRVKKSKEDTEVKSEEKKIETKVVSKVKEEAPKEEKKPEPTPLPTPVVAEPVEDDEEVDETKPLHIRRKKANKHIKTLVWNMHIGIDKVEGKCISCRQEKLDVRNFDCGHVIAEAKGGSMNINNLRPICRPCNGSMGTRSMNEFTKEFFGWEV